MNVVPSLIGAYTIYDTAVFIADHIMTNIDC